MGIEHTRAWCRGHWSQLAATGLLVLSLGIFVGGRGGRAVLAGAIVAFAALVVWLLAQPDGEPGEIVELREPGEPQAAPSVKAVADQPSTITPTITPSDPLNDRGTIKE